MTATFDEAARARLRAPLIWYVDTVFPDGAPQVSGCGLAGGSWERVEPLVVRRLVERGIPVTVYDFGA